MKTGRGCDLEALTVGQHRADGCRRCGCFYYKANGELRRVPPDDEEPTTVTARPACYPPRSGSFSFVPVAERIDVNHSGQTAYSVEWPDELAEPRITHRPFWH
jgi:hypothetical protein